jgi:hypothetical protein
MPRERIVSDIIPPRKIFSGAPEGGEDDEDEPADPHYNDWRLLNKAKSGLTLDSILYRPLLFKDSDPAWIQHWLMNALGLCSIML